MNKSVKKISIEELKQEKEYWDGCLKRRKKKDAYLENPRYMHPIYGTPLMEPYKSSANATVVKRGAITIKLRNPSS
jgi:hypothetical protein